MALSFGSLCGPPYTVNAQKGKGWRHENWLKHVLFLLIQLKNSQENPTRLGRQAPIMA